jgi:hypothetical protein
MTAIARLLARKQQLLERLHEDPGPHEREEIERLLAEIDTALNALEEMVPGRSTEHRHPARQIPGPALRWAANAVATTLQPVFNYRVEWGWRFVRKDAPDGRTAN